MLVARREVPVLVVNLAYIAFFGTLSLVRANYEFVIYALVIILFFALILATQRKVLLPLPLLWGLTAWGFLHMAGGHVFLHGTRLYDLVLVPVFTASDVQVLRYDHLVHALGFGVATLVCYHLLWRHLAPQGRNRPMVWVLVALMGMGLGALNEVVELIVVLIVPQSGVGGYYNTAFDLLFNALGAVMAVVGLNVARLIHGTSRPGASSEPHS